MVADSPFVPQSLPGVVQSGRFRAERRGFLTMLGSVSRLDGRIRDLSGFTSDGWRRREIIVRQGTNGYPKVRDNINLVDSSGATYSNLPFIKGAQEEGYVCLGQPGALKRWFTERYRFAEVSRENVYFESTVRPNEYRIYSESEWRAREGS